MSGTAAEPNIPLENEQKRGLIAVAVDSLLLGGIFSLFLQETAKQFLETLGHIFLFPIVAAIACYHAVNKIRTYWLDKTNANAFAHAIVETVAAVVIAIAVGVGFLGGVVAQYISSLLFAAVLAAKTGFLLVSAGYYFNKSMQDNISERQQQEYRTKARQNFAGFIGAGLATVAVIAVFILHKATFGAFGVASAAVGTAIASIHLYRKNQKEKADGYSAVPTVEPEKIAEGTNTNAMLKGLGATATPASQNAILTATPASPTMPGDNIIRQNSSSAMPPQDVVIDIESLTKAASEEPRSPRSLTATF